jgi:hypothetical protein
VEISRKSDHQAYIEIGLTSISHLRLKSLQKVQKEANSRDPNLRKLLAYVNLYEKSTNSERLQIMMKPVDTSAARTNVIISSVPKELEAFPDTKRLIVVHAEEVSNEEDDSGGDGSDALGNCCKEGFCDEKIRIDSPSRLVAPSLGRYEFMYNGPESRRGRESTDHTHNDLLGDSKVDLSHDRDLWAQQPHVWTQMQTDRMWIDNFS